MMWRRRRRWLLMMWMWSCRGCPIWLGLSELLSGFCLSSGTSTPRALSWISCYSLCVCMCLYVVSVWLLRKWERKKKKVSSSENILDALKSNRVEFETGVFFFFESPILDFCSILIVSCIFLANKRSVCVNCHGICLLLFFFGNLDLCYRFFFFFWGGDGDKMGFYFNGILVILIIG